MVVADVSIRPAVAQDGRFIADSWIRSFQGAWRVKKVAPEVYWRQHRDLISRLLEAGARVLVACDPQDTWTVWGWACGYREGSTFVVHYVYVKEAFRGPGLDLGTILFDALTDGGDFEQLVYTHDTRAAGGFLDGLRARGVVPLECPTIYNPYLLEGAR